MKSIAYIMSLLAVHTLPKPEVNAHVMEELQRDGMVENNGGDSVWRTSERGQAYAELLKAVPLPVQKWCDPRGSK